MTKDFTARCMEAAQLLKQHGYDDVAGFLAAAELSKRRASSAKPRKRKATLTRHGKTVRGGATSDINWQNPEIEYQTGEE